MIVWALGIHYHVVDQLRVTGPVVPSNQSRRITRSCKEKRGTRKQHSFEYIKRK